MPASPAQRIDALLASLPGALRRACTPAEPRPVLPTGVSELDRVLGGGLPKNALCEITGPRGSGRTLLVHRLLSATTAAGLLAALVDAADALDPASPALEGADLSRILWLRPRCPQEALEATERIVRSATFVLVVLDLGAPLRPRIRAATWLRLARAARTSGTCLAVLTPFPRAGSFAAVRLALRPAEMYWSGPILAGARLRIEVSRSLPRTVSGTTVRLQATGPV